MFFIVVLLLFSFLIPQYTKKMSPPSGDSDCDVFPSGEERNECCAELHKNDVTIECVGEWKYVEDEKNCKFVCDEGR